VMDGGAVEAGDVAALSHDAVEGVQRWAVALKTEQLRRM
jgi:hypothetical protein